LKLSWRNSAVLTRLSGPRLFDRTFFWWTYWVGFVVQITFDVIAYDSPSLLWLPVWTTGHLVATAFAVLARWTFLDKYLEKKPNPFVNIAVAGFLGVVRVTFIGYVSYALELQGLFDLGARIIAGLIAGTLGFIVIVNYTESSRSYRDVTKNLLLTQSRLSGQRRAVQKSLEANQKQVRNTLQELVEPKLRELSTRLGSENLKSSDRKTLANEVRSLLQDQVRPISSSFKTSTKAIANPNFGKSVSRLSLFRLPDVVQPYLALRPLLIGLSMFSILPFGLYVFEDDSWTTTGMLIAGLVYLAVLLVRLVLSKAAPMPLWVGIFSLLVLEALLIIVIADLLLLAGYPSRSLPAVVSIVGVVLFGAVAFTSITAVQDQNRDAFISQLEKNNNRIERDLALLNQRLWVERRQWALRIHGTVQASLTAALARLSQPGGLGKRDVSLVRAHLAQARKGLSQNTSNEFDLVEALKETKKTWRGILEIKTNFKSPAAKALIPDRWASVCANEIIKESVSNSMKHGKAQRVDISFVTSQPGFIEIVAQDDGKGLSRQFKPGLGSQLLDEIAFPWSLEKHPEGGAILRARIPVSGKKVKSAG
jgi:signal transduction histidine kinase